MKKFLLDMPAQSFEEVYKTSYSHGLESIYRIENIDLKTVKKLDAPFEKSLQAHSEPTLSNDGEVELDLGPAFSGYLEPFVLKEPIQVLKLSRHTEKCLIEQNFRSIGDLNRSDFSKLVFIKGIGQGHVEEIKEKLRNYLKGKATIKSKYIDFSSWIREVAGDLEAKLAYVVLEPYGLASEIPLSPLENADIKKLSIERKMELIELARAKLAHPDKMKAVLDRFEEILECLVRPWIFSRSGVATADEIEERLERVALNPSLAKKALRFLTETYKHNGFPFSLPSEGHLYFASAESWGRFKAIERATLAYFWNEEAQYLFIDLHQKLAKEFSRHWDILTEQDFKKVVSYSPQLERRKLLTGALLIKRSSNYFN